MSNTVYGLVLVLHILVSLFLVGVVLLQGGRGGLGEALGGAAAQSLFGGSANIVMARLTAVVAGIFMATCLSLAALSTARGRSVIDQVPVDLEQLPGPLAPGGLVPEPKTTAPAEPAPAAASPAAPDAPPSPSP